MSEKAPEQLTIDDLEVGMRVMLTSGQMRGVIIAVSSEGFSVRWDKTRAPMEYEAADIDMLQREA